MHFFAKMFQGRVGRIGFLLPALFLFVFPLVQWFFVALLFNTIHFQHPERYLIEPTHFFMLIVILSLTLPLLLIPTAIRRLHDLNQSGWFVIFIIIPVLNILAALFLSIIPNNKKTNTYGRIPQSPKRKTVTLCIALFITLLFIDFSTTIYITKKWCTRPDNQYQQIAAPACIERLLF